MKKNVLALTIGALFVGFSATAQANIVLPQVNQEQWANAEAKNFDQIADRFQLMILGYKDGNPTNNGTINVVANKDFTGWLSFASYGNYQPDQTYYKFDAKNHKIDVSSHGLILEVAHHQTKENVKNAITELKFGHGASLTGDIINYGVTWSNSKTTALGNNNTITFDGATWNGNIYSNTKSFVSHSIDQYNTENNITLKNGATWVGNAISDDKLVNEKTNVAIDAQSAWTVTGHSRVNNLAGEGSVIVADNATLTMVEGTSHINQVSFNGNSRMILRENANVTIQKGDNGSYQLDSFTNTSLNLVESKNANFYVNPQLNTGSTQDVLNKVDTAISGNANGNIFIESNAVTPEIFGQITNGQIVNSNTQANPNILTVNDVNTVLMTQWRAEADDMVQRMGELRDNTSANGLWVRNFGGKMEATKAENEFVGFQFGYDHQVAQGATRQWIGGALSYTKGDAKLATGTGDNESFAFSGYSTWLFENNSYVDVIAKVGKLTNEFKFMSTVGQMNADYSTHGIALTVESGHRFPLTESAYIEPQIAFTASHIFGETFGIGQNATVNQASINSYVGRVGLATGLACPDNRGNVWVRASYLYDFDGKSDLKATAGQDVAHFDQDFGGQWYELGLGASLNLTKNLHGFADFEYAAGGSIDTPYKWNIGVRYAY